MIRVAAAQYSTSTDINQNLSTIIRTIDEAAGKYHPDILVLPEFSNYPSLYDSQDHAYEVAVDLNSDFIRTIGQAAVRNHVYVMINCTVKRQDKKVTGTNILFCRKTGSVIEASDKQVLMGHENDNLVRASSVGRIVTLEDLGGVRVGLYSCMDGVINETPRGLALRGAHVLLNSLNSFSLDEASLHIPVRAAENKVFVVAANKVGPLAPEKIMGMVSQRLGIAADMLDGAGESQIVAPDGTVLAKAPLRGEAVVCCDIDFLQAERKTRPDGTHIFAARRPDRYNPIADEPRWAFDRKYFPLGPAKAKVAACSATSIESACSFLTEAARAGEIDVIVLPELFSEPFGLVSDLSLAVANGRRACHLFFTILHRECNSNKAKKLFICFSMVHEDGSHVGVLLGPEGVVLSQPQMHASLRHSSWQRPAHLASKLQVVDTPFGKCGIILADDSIYPESFRLVALQDCEVVLCPHSLSEVWETSLGLKERAAENRVNLVVASRPNGQLRLASVVYALHKDFSFWTTWTTRTFDGNMNSPIVTQADPAVKESILVAEIYPACAENKIMSKNTHLLSSRPSASLVRQSGLVI